MSDPSLKPFDFDEVQVGAELGSYEYEFTQEMLDRFREAIDDPEAVYGTIGVKHDATSFRMVYDDQVGGVNAGNEMEFFNPPVPGKRIRVTGRVSDKYWRRDKPYFVTESTAVDEDGRLLEMVRTYQLKRPEEVGKKWHPQG